MRWQIQFEKHVIPVNWQLSVCTEKRKKRMSENNFERICKVLISRVTLNDAKREKESKKTWSSALAALTSSRVENWCAARHTHMLIHISLGCLTCLFYQVHQLSPASWPADQCLSASASFQLAFFCQQDAPTLQNLRFILLLQFKKMDNMTYLLTYTWANTLNISREGNKTCVIAYARLANTHIRTQADTHRHKQRNCSHFFIMTYSLCIQSPLGFDRLNQP